MTSQSPANVFDEHQSYLTGIAYRMLGSVADAEDVVQETYLRWQKTDNREVRSPKAWLTTAANRLAIDHLRSARVRRESYVGVWLPEPLLTGSSADPSGAPFAAPDQSTELLDSLSTAMLMLLEQLSPTERAAFLLHDVFDYDYNQVAPILERSPAACRQLVSRARARIKDGRPRFESSHDARDRMLVEFGGAVRPGNVSGLIVLMSEDVTLMSDGGGKVNAALKPIFGADKVSRFFIGISKKQPVGAYFQIREVNGMAGVVELVGGKITCIHIVNNPDKLAHIGPPDIGQLP